MRSVVSLLSAVLATAALALALPAAGGAQLTVRGGAPQSATVEEPPLEETAGSEPAVGEEAYFGEPSKSEAGGLEEEGPALEEATEAEGTTTSEQEGTSGRSTTLQTLLPSRPTLTAADRTLLRRPPVRLSALLFKVALKGKGKARGVAVLARAVASSGGRRWRLLLRTPVTLKAGRNRIRLAARSALQGGRYRLALILGRRHSAPLTFSVAHPHRAHRRHQQRRFATL